MVDAIFLCTRIRHANIVYLYIRPFCYAINLSVFIIDY